MASDSMSCRGWPQEAALRMLHNNLHPDVAERPEDLVVYGGIGKAARNWSSYHTIERELRRLGDGETLLVQSGKPVAVFETHPDAPRVLIANSNLVGQWANWETFRELDAAGLMMYGQMTAGSWIYIGSQGILQGTYETFAAAARLRFGGSLAGRLVVTAGLGGMGGAQPLAVTMLDGAALCIEVDLQRIERRIETRYLDERAADLDDALARLAAAQSDRRGLSIGLAGNAAEILPELVRRGVAIDIVTDQTSAHDPLNGYVPVGVTVEQAEVLRRSDPDDYLRRVGESAVAHVGAIRALAAAGAEAFDYGNALRGLAFSHGDSEAFSYPGFVPAYIRPLFCEGKGPFRWVALSGDPADIHATDRAILELFGDQEHIARWISLAQERVAFQGLPARICWLGYGERELAGVRFNEMVASGELRGPIVIGRDHLDAGSVASPERETEAMRDGSDAIADWPLLNAMLMTACGASWVSIHQGGGVGMGKSIHAGQVVVADGTAAAGERVRRTLTADPGLGVVRHADAGYPEALAVARSSGLRMPMLDPASWMTPAADLPASLDGERRRSAGGPVSGRSVALRGAGQILRPPRPRLPWLRGADLAAQTLAGGDLGWSGGILGEGVPGGADLELDVTGCTVVPGFVDCHTHLPFAGWRAGEYAQKLAGVPYAEIASGGGGIRASARALAGVSDDRVLTQARALASEMLAAGTTTFEMKSGYGLSREAEIRALRLAAELAAQVPQTTLSTALLAHAVPDGYDAAGWMREVGEMMGEVVDLGSVSALDIFVETIAFSVSDLAEMGALARAAGLMLRTHVEQFERLGSVPVALTAGARSVDHLSVASADDVALLADAACAAVLLPAAEFLGAEHRAPGRALADAGALVVLASDANPGTAPVVSMPVVIGLAARLYGLSPLETLAASTLNAAWTLGLEATLGSIEPGKRADVLVLDGPVESIAYRFGRNPVAVAFVGGEPAFVRDDWADRVVVRA